MNEEIRQLEFQGAEGGGYSVVAATAGLDTELWEHFLRPLARPPRMGRTTVVYQTFGAEAAIVFRSPLSAPSDVLPGRAELAARAIIGSCELLRPDIAMGCAAADLPEFFRPPAGQAEHGMLPGLSAGELWVAATDERLRKTLDALASGSPLLRRLLAATLAFPDKHLAVHVPYSQLSDRQLVAPLWGLWRLAAPLLGPRDWTFSTGEEPLGDKSPAELPHLIIRDIRRGEDRRPGAQRDELVIGPETAASYGTEQVADQLAEAYGRLSEASLQTVLSQANAAGATVKDRLRAVQELLSGRETAALPGTQAAQDDVLYGPPDVGNGDLSYYPYQLPSRQDARGAGQPVPGLEEHAASGGSLGEVLRRLTEQDPQAVADLMRMAGSPDRPDPQDRVALRRKAAEQRWFVKELSRLRPRDVEFFLHTLLSLIIVPDLNDAARCGSTTRELRGMIRDDATPAVVLLALEEMFWDRGDQVLHEFLVHEVGRRWLADHGRYDPPVKLRPPGTSRRPRSRKPRWLPFKGTEARMPALVANIGVLLLVVETLVLCVIVGIR